MSDSNSDFQMCSESSLEPLNNENDLPAILILDNDCLLHIFNDLTVVDLVNFAETCRRISNEARSIYKKYSEIEYSQKLFDATNEATVDRIFSNIGFYISSLTINFESNVDICESIFKYCPNVHNLKYKTRGLAEDGRIFQHNQGQFRQLRSLEMHNCVINNGSIFGEQLECLSLISCRVNLWSNMEAMNSVQNLTVIQCSGSGLLQLTNSTKNIKKLVFYSQGSLPKYNTIKNVESLDVDVDVDVDVNSTLRLKKIHQLSRLRILRVIYHNELRTGQFLLKLAKKNCSLEELHLYKQEIDTTTMSAWSEFKKLKVLNLQYPFHSHGNNILRGISQALPDLKEFHFIKSSSVSSKGIISFYTSMKTIEKLNFCNCDVAASTLNEINDLIKLEPSRKLEFTTNSILYDDEVRFCFY